MLGSFWRKSLGRGCGPEARRLLCSAVLPRCPRQCPRQCPRLWAVGGPSSSSGWPSSRYCTEADYGRELSDAEYECVAEETLESLAEAMEELSDFLPVRPEFDLTYSQGVLTALISEEFGTYVINKQSPNKQIWLSSPVSGPKRYHYAHNRVKGESCCTVLEGRWQYGREEETLHELLQRELREYFASDKISLTDCAHAGDD